MPATRSFPKDDNSIKQIAIRVRVGTVDVQLKGPEIHGKWAVPTRVLAAKAEGELLSNFANWPGDAYDLDTANEIVRFTRRYGPLEVPAVPGLSFSFNYAEWIHCREVFRDYWRALGEKTNPKHWSSAPDQPSAALQDARKLGAKLLSSEDVQLINDDFRKLHESWSGLKIENSIWPKEKIADGEFFGLSEGVLTYGTGTLWKFLRLILFATPGERLRRCHNPGRHNPFFIAQHLNQNFCSEVSARWGQRRASLAWWNRKGKAERAKLHEKKGRKK